MATSHTHFKHPHEDVNGGAAPASERAHLKAERDRKSSGEQTKEAARGARLIAEAMASHATVVESWKQLLHELGIAGQAIGAKQLRERLLAEGINPDDNILSRQILAMREE